MDLTKLAESLFEGENAEVLKTLQSSTGVSSDQLGGLLSQFLPKITEAILGNFLSGNLIPSLMSLAASVDVSSLSENPSEILNDKNTKTGNDILSLIFGGDEKVQELNSTLSATSSISTSSLSSLLPALSTAVIGIVMSNQGGGLGSLVSSMFGQDSQGGSINPASAGGLMDMAKSFLDKDGDGSIMDDVFSGLTKK